ncbi:MAG: RNA polymerase sigma factor [Kofleriaceae bacterium]|nr:RNA polymerase sigma factor [Kofleriaceae bacterium]MCB9572991.1 RNA polymerase sigma factor [Kofleriaceae bacterium]
MKPARTPVAGVPRMGEVIPLRRAPTTTEAVSDEALVAACALGDAAALGTLFDRHHEALWRFLGRMSRGGAAELDDLAQGTFVEVWRSASRFRGGAAVRTWIFGIAANLVRRRARDEGRRRAALADLAAVPRPAPAGRAPDDALMRRQMVDRIGAAMAGLSHELREVFVLCDVEEIPGVEVARALGLREGTVWRRLHDARKALRRALEGGGR